ncbi:MAG: hypothetical protein K2P84_06780 [Undibacterium sp.]|nr:hypothetical protein [Undibacterium sp.]
MIPATARIFISIGILLVHLALLIAFFTHSLKTSPGNSAKTQLVLLVAPTQRLSPTVNTLATPNAPVRISARLRPPSLSSTPAEPLAPKANEVTAISPFDVDHSKLDIFAKPKGRSLVKDATIQLPLAYSSPANQAANDPRSNSVRLTKNEKFAIGIGAVGCIYQERLADGRIYREEGRIIEIPASGDSGRRGVKVRVCVANKDADVKPQ